VFFNINRFFEKFKNFMEFLEMIPGIFFLESFWGIPGKIFKPFFRNLVVAYETGPKLSSLSEKSRAICSTNGTKARAASRQYSLVRPRVEPYSLTSLCYQRQSLYVFRINTVL